MANWKTTAQTAQTAQTAFTSQLAKQLRGSNTISINGAAGAQLNPGVLGGNSGPWNSLVFSEERHAHVKKYEVFETTEDILLLSVAWQRRRKERDEHNIVLNISSITDEHLFDSITVEDREKTEKIRDYYSKKFVMWALNDIRLTNFREDLKKLIQSDGKIFQENIKPLAYRLPEFYDYDISFDEMFIEHDTKIKPTPEKVNKKTLSLVKTLMHRRRSSIFKEYWFKDDNYNLNVIIVSKDNPLLSLMDYYSRDKVTIQGNFAKKVRDNREYFVIEKYSFS